MIDTQENQTVTAFLVAENRRPTFLPSYLLTLARA
jgi:hypothetical protein